MKRTGFSVGAAAWLLAAGMTVPAHADVRTITITARGPALNGQSFGTVGPYEQITGIATGEINPADPRNALITDIDLAPRNTRGMVEYRTTFTIRKPVDMSHAPGVLFYNIVNRGNPGGPANWHVGGDPGDGFLYNLGHALLWSGWQGDQPIASVGAGREGIDVPVAKNRDGSPVTGRVVERFINVPGAVNTQPVGGAGRMPLTLDTTKAVLISAASETPSGVKGGVTTIPSTDWAFADCRTVPFPGTPDPVRLCLKSGFDPALLYELTYTAKDPYVLGVGMAAMRDVVSFFRYTEKDSAGTANPLFGLVPHVIGMGNSQSGRLAKAFLNLGFNEDEHGRMVWDGLNVRIAGMLGSFNTRFAQPGDIAELYMPGAEGPALVGRLRRQGARVAGVGAAPPLQRVPHLPEDHRDLRRAGGLVQPRHDRHCRDDGERRPGAARERPPLLPRWHFAWRRHGRVQPRDTVERSQRAREQSQPGA